MAENNNVEITEDSKIVAVREKVGVVKSANRLKVALVLAPITIYGVLVAITLLTHQPPDMVNLIVREGGGLVFALVMVILFLL